MFSLPSSSSSRRRQWLSSQLMYTHPSPTEKYAQWRSFERSRFMFHDFVEHTSRNKAQRFCVILSDDQIWTSLQVGNLDEKNTEKVQGGTTFEESISLLIYDLANDKVHILLPVCTWRHGGHVSGQKQKHFSPLGNKLYFHVNSSKKNYYMDHQHGRLVTWFQHKNIHGR